MNNLKIAVIGGSLGGLFTAHALRKAGFEVDIYERSKGEANTRGAGIVFQRDLSEYMRQNNIADPEAISTFCHTRKFYNQSGQLSHQDPAYQRFVSWEALYKSLRNVTPAKNLHEGFHLNDFMEKDGQVILKFENGESRIVDLMVAADGVHSNTRVRLLNGKKPTYAGYIGWRGVIEESDFPEELLEELEDTFSFCHIPNSHFLTYMIPGEGMKVEKGKRRVNWVWYKNVEEGADLDYYMTDKNGKRHDFSIGEGMLRSELKDRLFDMANKELPKLFFNIALRTREPFLQPILDMDIDQMVFGRVVLLGDAAFVVRPHTAASTYKAAIDGITLANSLKSGDDLDRALKGWEIGQIRVGKGLIASGQMMGNRSQFPTK